MPGHHLASYLADCYLCLQLVFEGAADNLLQEDTSSTGLSHREATLRKRYLQSACAYGKSTPLGVAFSYKRFVLLTLRLLTVQMKVTSSSTTVAAGRAS